MRHDDHERHTWEQRARQHAHQTREWTTATRKQRTTWEKGVRVALEQCTNNVRRRVRSEWATHADTHDDAREIARETTHANRMAMKHANSVHATQKSLTYTVHILDM
jgi:hypothetical protein